MIGSVPVSPSKSRTQGHSNWSTVNDYLVKFILILLAGLLLANSILFYKLWDLEDRLIHATPSTTRSPPYPDFDPTEFLQYESKQEGPKNTIDWMKVLHRQEVIHQMELEKWHEMIGGATELLRQVRTNSFQSFFQAKFSFDDIGALANIQQLRARSNSVNSCHMFEFCLFLNLTNALFA